MNIKGLVPNQGSAITPALIAGLDTISANQSITFNLYKQVILPLDGFVYWVRADLLSPIPTYPLTIQVSGSLHYSSDKNQNEDETVVVQSILFTTNKEIAPLNDLEDTLIYLGCFQGLEFTFSARTSFYQQSNVYHYKGDAVYPAMKTQIINDAAQLIDQTQVVSNSLPLWMAQNALMPVYPAYIAPVNLVPPYATVQVNTESQVALQSTPYLDNMSNHSQLIKEKVKIVIYGLRNNTALNFQDYVINNSLNDTFGILNMPIIKDEVRTQSELNIRGMKKSIEFEISYYQSVSNAIAKKLINTCIPSYTIS